MFDSSICNAANWLADMLEETCHSSCSRMWGSAHRQLVVR
jgi:hypothetical protein